MKIPQNDRLPKPGEEAEIGTVTVNGNYTPLTTTRAWCHQQGCMELFLKHRPNCFIYNDFDAKDQRLHAKIFELGKGIVGQYELPILRFRQTGNGCLLNFVESGRGSAMPIPRSHGINKPNLGEDGLFLVDLETAKANSGRIGKFRIIQSRTDLTMSILAQ